MDFLEWATSPWGQRVPIHIAWFLIWVAVIAGSSSLLFTPPICAISPDQESLRAPFRPPWRRASPSMFPDTR